MQKFEWGNSNDSSDSDISVRSVNIYDGDDEVKKTVELMKTQNKQFNAQIYPTNATDTRMRWKSSDEKIAEVDENGVVTGIHEGEVKIYAISRDNGRQDVITVKIVPYVRYADAITITPQENAVYETGSTVKFNVTFQPEDTTERNIRWFVYGGSATVDSLGYVTITDKSKVTVKAHTSDWKQTASFDFESQYSQNHFNLIGQSYNIKQNRAIVLTFDTDVDISYAKNSIFASTDRMGNKNIVNIDIEVVGKKVIITPSNGWTVGESYIFIKSNLCDIYGNRLEKNIKYLINVRSVSGGKI